MADNLWTSFLFSAIIGLVLLIFFMIGRSTILKSFYSPKYYYRNDDNLKSWLDITEWGPVVKDAGGVFGWIKTTLQFPYNTILESGNRFGHGEDMVIHLRFLKYLIIYFAALSFLGMVVLVPINATGKEKHLWQALNGTNPDGTTNTFIEPSWMFNLTMAHIEKRSNMMWFHLTSVFVFSGLTFYLIDRMYKAGVEMRLRQMKRPLVENRIVMVTELGERLKDSQLKAKFEDYYGEGSITCAIACPDVPKNLREISERRKMAEKELKKAQEILNFSGKRPKHLPITNIHKGERTPLLQSLSEVDSIDFYTQEISKLNDQFHRIFNGFSEDESTQKDSFQSLDDAHPSENFHPTSVGFIAFKSVNMALNCAQTQHDTDPSRIVTCMAPERGDIKWEYVGILPTERHVRRGVVTILLLCLFLFWLLPITFIASLSSLESLARVPGLKSLTSWVIEHATLASVVQGFLSTLALHIFMAILPLLIRLILSQNHTRLKSTDEIESMVVYWVFLLVNVFLVSTVAGSLIKSMETILNDPKSIPTALALSLPAQSSFFLNYIIVGAFINTMLSLARIPDLIISRLKIRVLKSRSEKRALDFPEDYHLSDDYARQLLIFCIGLTYSTIAPLILPMVTIYYSISYLCIKYNFLHVFGGNPPHGGQQVVPYLCQAMTVALFIYQFTTVGVMGLKEFPAGGAILLLSVFTAIYMHYVSKKYSKALQVAALDEFSFSKTRLVLSNNVQEMAPNDDSEVYALYCDPAVIPPNRDEPKV